MPGEQSVIGREAVWGGPYGLGLAPDPHVYEYDDPRNEAAVEARWRPILDRLGIEILGARDVLDHSQRIVVDGVEWELRPMDPTKTYDLPPIVYHRIKSAEAEGVPFDYWLWGEELLARNWPTVRLVVDRVPSPATRRRRGLFELFDDFIDPIVIGVIPTAPNRGVWCCLGKWFH